MRFIDCELDLSARRLERAGMEVALEPKVYDLLEVLIYRRPAVVTNAELDELLWPRMYVMRTSLTRLVSKLRTALGDSSRDPYIIRTAYKIGYAFCASVTDECCADALRADLELNWHEHSLPLTDGKHLAGRDDTCAFVIDAGTVSRRHAQITVESGRVMIEDLGSTNGTQVNGSRISKATRLRSGDEILIGRERLLIKRHVASALTTRMDCSGTDAGSRGV